MVCLRMVSTTSDLGRRARGAYLVLLITLAADLVLVTSGAPMDHLAAFRGTKRGVGLSSHSGWGMRAGDLLQSLADENNRVNNMDDAVRFILSRDMSGNSPSLRPFLSDRLFRRHLQLMIDKPSLLHLRQLQNRLSALHRRRTDEVSSRFFLRD